MGSISSMYAAMDASSELRKKYRWQNMSIGRSFMTACTDARHQNDKKSGMNSMPYTKNPLTTGMVFSEMYGLRRICGV